MKNYAEQLAYLYFRLNGFFLIDNYVSHASETENGRHADSDLLAIKPPFVHEIVGLNNPRDIESLNGLLQSKTNEAAEFHPEKYVAVICEVKGGESYVYDLVDTKLKSCLRRIGMLADNQLIDAQEALRTQDSFSTANVFIAKVLVSRVDQPRVNSYLRLSTREIIDFLRSRVERYPEKRRAWNHYGSDILQLILTEDL